MTSGLSIDPLLFATALAAGMVSFASPCVLPLVPAYLGFITGRSAEEIAAARGRARLGVLGHGAAFVLGLGLVFSLLGASATLLGQSLLQNLPLLWKVGGVLVVVFGLQMLGVVNIPALYRTARLAEVAPNRAGHASHGRAFLLGAAFGAGWTPCVGPVLAGLLGLASSQDTVGAGMALLLVYALGLGLPFLLAGLAVDRSLRVMRALRPHLPTVERASGLLLVGMGVLLFTERLTLVTAWLTRLFGTGLAL